MSAATIIPSPNPSLPTTDPALSGKIKEALRRHAKAVVVISCQHASTRYAMAATATVELSLEPPSLLICVNKSASIHRPLSSGGAAKFCVNILRSNQQDIAAICSGKVKGEARFGTGNWAFDDEGTPYLADAQACFFCELDGGFEYGTHVVYVGAIKAVDTNGEVDPLVYANRAYTLLNSAKAWCDPQIVRLLDESPF
jgi:flavin reductase (DIM6/NTAB) family NADH-FMN oxidoreductase RutF